MLGCTLRDNLTGQGYTYREIDIERFGVSCCHEKNNSLFASG